MFAVGNLSDERSCLANIMPTLSGPSLPINMTTASVYSAYGESMGGKLMESPVVVNAVIVSKNT